MLVRLFYTDTDGWNIPLASDVSKKNVYASSVVYVCIYMYIFTRVGGWVTTSGGMGEQFQRRDWNPHWIRVAEEDEALKIGPWVASLTPG